MRGRAAYIVEHIVTGVFRPLYFSIPSSRPRAHGVADGHADSSGVSVGVGVGVGATLVYDTHTLVLLRSDSTAAPVRISGFVRMNVDVSASLSECSVPFPP
jgi:hypothetical protein